MKETDAPLFRRKVRGILPTVARMEGTNIVWQPATLMTVTVFAWPLQEVRKRLHLDVRPNCIRLDDVRVYRTPDKFGSEPDIERNFLSGELIHNGS